VYPEHLPPARRPRPGRPLDRVLTGWGADPELIVLNLRGSLTEAKPHGPVYFHTDTHWNSAGSFLAYRRTVAALARWYPGLAPQPASAYDWPTFSLHDPDLVRLLALPGRVSEPFALPQPRFTPRVKLLDEVVPVDETARLQHLQSHVWAG